MAPVHWFSWTALVWRHAICSAPAPAAAGCNLAVRHGCACEPANKRYRISLTLLSNSKAMARKIVEYKCYAASLNIGPPTKPLTFRDHTLFFSASQCRYKIKRLCNASRCGCCLLLFFFRLGCCLLFYFEWKFVVYCYVLCHQKVAGRLPAKG